MGQPRATAGSASLSSEPPQEHWDIFCRVVDNYGDAALCWRLARQLAQEHGVRTRLWIDHLPTLAALLPQAQAGTACAGVQIERWSDNDARLTQPADHEIPPVVIAALGCTLPEGYRSAMRRRQPPPVWINLEHLSAEDWVADCHGLGSPKPDGLVEYFFFPGFTAQTGGLLREARLLHERAALNAHPEQAQAWLQSLGLHPQPGERYASLFCYRDSPIVPLLQGLAAQPQPWRLVVPHGVLTEHLDHPCVRRIPFLSQDDYDRLLWSCELNFVRGEDSFIRGLWAARPMIWQAYRQPEAAHHPKVTAFLAHWHRTAQPSARAEHALIDLTHAWNDMAAAPPLQDALGRVLAELPALQAASQRWVATQSKQPDLARRLYDWVQARL